MTDRPRVAVLRPPGDRAARAETTLEELGIDALLDPMVEPRPTGAVPRADAEVTVFTSSTAADVIDDAGWAPSGGEVAAIGPRTAQALREVGIDVDVVPETYDSRGLVAALASHVDGRRVEVARSDHGSDTLTEGLNDAGAYVHETVLYRLERPTDAGRSVEALLAGELDAIAFTSSLTVEHFLELVAERGDPDRATAALDAAVVGAIGEPTAETARANGLAVDVIASEATFEALARALAEPLEVEGSRHV